MTMMVQSTRISGLRSFSKGTTCVGVRFVATILSGQKLTNASSICRTNFNLIQRHSFFHVSKTNMKGFTVTNDLEQLLMEATNDSRKIPKFYRALLEADVYFLKDSFHDPTSPGKLGLQLWMKGEDHFLPIWTSTTALRQTLDADGIPPYFKMDTDAVWAFYNFQRYMDDPNMVMFPPMPACYKQTHLWTKGKRLFENEFEEFVVLNPGLDYGKEFTRKEIEDIVDNMSEIEKAHGIDKADGSTVASRIRKAVAKKKKTK